MLSTHVEGVEDFSHCQGNERHGHTVKAVNNFPTPGFQIMAYEVGYQRYACQHNALVCAVEAHAAGKDAFVGGTRFAFHNIGFAFFHAQCQCWECVGNKVNPQKVNRQQDGKAHHGRYENTDNLGKVGRKQELNGFTDVVVNAAAFFNCCNDGCKVIVGKYHIGNVFGNVGTGNAHAYTDIGVFNGRSVVYAVAGHSGYFAACLPCFYDTNLVFRLYARIYGVFFNSAAVEFSFADFVKLCAGNCLRSIFNNTELFSNGNCGVDMVAGNHNRADACAVAFFNSVYNFGANRVNHAGNTNED